MAYPTPDEMTGDFASMMGGSPNIMLKLPPKRNVGIWTGNLGGGSVPDPGLPASVPPSAEEMTALLASMPKSPDFRIPKATHPQTIIGNFGNMVSSPNAQGELSPSSYNGMPTPGGVTPQTFSSFGPEASLDAFMKMSHGQTLKDIEGIRAEADKNKIWDAMAVDLIANQESSPEEATAKLRAARGVVGGSKKPATPTQNQVPSSDLSGVMGGTPQSSLTAGSPKEGAPTEMTRVHGLRDLINGALAQQKHNDMIVPAKTPGGDSQAIRNFSLAENYPLQNMASVEAMRPGFTAANAEQIKALMAARHGIGWPGKLSTPNVSLRPGLDPQNIQAAKLLSSLGLEVPHYASDEAQKPMATPRPRPKFFQQSPNIMFP